MTIDRAIELLKQARHDCGMIPPEEYTPLIDLAREALKELKQQRLYPHSAPKRKLRGETLT